MKAAIAFDLDAPVEKSLPPFAVSSRYAGEHFPSESIG